MRAVTSTVLSGVRRAALPGYPVPSEGVKDNMSKLVDKVALITGASKGLGRCIAELLVSEGVKVALAARPSPQLAALGRELGDAAFAVECDVRSARSVEAAIEAAVRHFGGLDILVNNAATCLLHEIETSTDDEILAEVETNLLGSIWSVRAAIPHLTARGGGDIAFVSSESVLLPYPFLTLYAATKAAIETFARGLRSELRPNGTRVTVLRAGSMTESSIAGGWDPERAKRFFEVAGQSGHLALTGAGNHPSANARALVEMFKLPRDANADLIEVRSRL
jgi:NADP-dependent 3-hydroxy acid dehydrogenase YdfG